MGSGSKVKCRSASHKLFKDKAKNRVDDLQVMFADLQFARKESRVIDVAVLEEQVHQMLCEWKAELNQSSPASSLQQCGSIELFSEDICRLLQLHEEEDDATSTLAALKHEPEDYILQFEDYVNFEEIYDVNPGQSFNLEDQSKDVLVKNAEEESSLLDYNNVFDVPQSFERQYSTFTATDVCDGGVGLLIDDSLSCPPPSAFLLGPKCALWDCSRPVNEGSGWSLNYCSNFHYCLALNEGPLGMPPVVRPGGICLKDGLLFAAVRAKAEGKDAGIPECEGAATAKSPWNAPDLFDLSVLEGETIREWLFFDKPRRAFESGNRKQRSLPDYNGRGWHESRKQVLNEYGGLKRSHYMDPQPLSNYEWHLYEYEINDCNACALYRLELKAVDANKSNKCKNTGEPLADLQNQMGSLNSELQSDYKFSA